MKRPFAFLSSALILAQISMPVSAAGITDPTDFSGPSGANYFPDAVLSSSGFQNYDYTAEAISASTKDVSLSKNTGSALYIGLETKFDGVAIDVGSYSGTTDWSFDYWDGDSWNSFYESSTMIKNTTSGSYSYSWDTDDLSDWDASQLFIFPDLTYTDELYFVRFYLEDSSLNQDAKFDQVGILKYNFEVNTDDELGNALTGYDPEDLLEIENMDDTIYGSMEDNGLYRYALHAATAIVDYYDMDYEFSVPGYVTKSGTETVSKTTVNGVDAELKFSHKISASNENGDDLTITNITQGSSDCTISGGDAYCAVTTASTLNTYSISAEGYVNKTASLTSGSTSSQTLLEPEMDYAYLVNLTKEGSSTTIAGATVKMGDDLDITCDDLGSGNYGCAVPADETDGDIKITKSGYESLSDSLSNSETRDSADDAQVELSYELSSTSGSSGDGPDFEVNNIYMSGDDLVVSVGNDGDEDVDDTVKIKVYIDGDLEETISSSSADWLDAGGTTLYNLGDGIYGSKDEFEVEVCVDTSDAVDESNEDNNCLTEDIELDGDKPDLTVDDLDIQDDGDITFEVKNEGEADVDDDIRVYIYVYVDGDKEWTRSYEIDSSEGKWLEENEDRTINVGELFDDGDEHTVRVCVDAKDDVDESDEGNNCSSKDLEVGESPGNSYYCGVFIDMTTHWAADAVCELSDRGIIKGRSGNRYEPNEDVTRAEFLKIILLNAGHNVSSNSNYYYHDVPTYHWAHEYVTYASSLGIVRGYSDGNFHPDSPVTRGEAVVMIMRLYGEELWGYDSNDIDFSDVYTWDWYAYAVILADNYGIVQGYSDGRFLPNNYLDRGEAAVIAERTYEALN